MSSGLIRSNILSFISKENISSNYQNEIIFLIENIDDNFLNLLFTLIENSNLTAETKFARVRAITIQHCSIQLADDVVDKEFSPNYIYKYENPVLLMILQSLYLKALKTCKLSTKISDSLLNNNLKIAKALHDEIRQKKWSYENYIILAKEMGGNYYKSIFSILCNNQLLNKINFGFKFGTIIHIVTDITSGDDRFYSMNNNDKLKVLNFVEESILNINIPSFLQSYKRNILYNIKNSRKTFPINQDISPEIDPSFQ